MFDLASSSYGVDRDNIRLAPDFQVETVNRSVEEGDLVMKLDGSNYRTIERRVL